MRVNHGICKNKSKYKEDLEKKEILCDICGFSATSKRSMRIHIQSKCISKSNKNTSIYKNKTKNISLKKNYHRCTKCAFESRSPYYLNTHKYEQHMTELPACSVCGIIYKNRICLLKHMKEKHPIKGLVCDICDYIATSLWLLNKHKNSVHFKMQYPCTLCDYKGPGKNNLHMHKMRVHKECYLKCNDCVYMAGDYMQLKDHKKKNHNIEQSKTTISSTVNNDDIKVSYPEDSLHNIQIKYPEINLYKLSH